MTDSQTEADPRIAAAAGGNRAAAESLFRELLPRARNLVRYLIRGDVGVDDISQEALVAVFRGLSGYRGDGRFEAWVDRIVARSTFQTLKRQRREPSAPNLEPELRLVGARTDEYLNRRDVVRLLDRLPAQQRHALVLHHVLGMTVSEVSAQLDTHQETVRSRLRLAKQRLRQLSQSRQDGSDD